MQAPAQETKSVNSYIAGVIDELHNVGTGNQTCVLWKSSEQSDPLRHLTIPFLVFLKHIYGYKILTIQI